MQISLLIPVLNEGSNMAALIGRVQKLKGLHEVILADGGSRDHSTDLARAVGWRVIHSAAGRGIQLEAARKAAEGELLWMLHADTIPPVDGAQRIVEAFRNPRVQLSAFPLSYYGGGWPMKLVAAGGMLRNRIRRRPYGDQALAVRAESLANLGGFPAWPFLEDLWLVDQIRHQKGALKLLPGNCRTSARRYTENGVLRTLWQHQRILHYYQKHGKPLAAGR